jgi:type IV secretion system protein VirB10
VSADAEPRGSPVADPVAGERSIASVNEARSLQSRISNLLAMGLMSTLGLGFLGWYYAHTWTHHTEVKKAAQAASRSQAAGEMALPSLGRIDPPAPAVAQALGPPPPLPASAIEVPGSSPGTPTPVAVAPAASASPPKSLAQQALERRLAGPVAVGPEVANEASSSEPPGPEASASGAPVAPAAAAPAASDPMTALLKPSATPAVQASVLPGERLLLPKGAFIDCTLETAIDSTLPGMTTCITATDTFGADGSTVLIERGSKLVGETRGVVEQGAARVFVLWTEARTPTGVVVPLASPGTDELGRSGLSGEVNRHFFERFGAALLISIIDGVVQGAVAQQSRGGTVIYSPQASSDVMEEVLKGTVNIPPTITKAQGDRIQVLVARDLDFRSVYDLRPQAR